VDDSSRSAEAHHESVGRRLLYKAAELKSFSDGSIITSYTPIERYRKN